MLKESRLYTFIDREKKFALYFLEGQQLIHDLVLTHNLKSGGFTCFRSAVLSVQLMLSLLKHGEYFCFYIDSESPYFRLKIEMDTRGRMRGMIYPSDLNVNTDIVTGQARLMKFLPETRMPYQSTIELRGVGMDHIINHVLSQSYQVSSRIMVSEASDQSVMLHQLPLSSREEPSDLTAAFDAAVPELKALMAKGLTDPESIRAEFQKIGFAYLADRPVRFACGCSKEQMIENVKTFVRTSGEDLFSQDKPLIEVVCEYCKAAYQITEKDIREHSSVYH